MKTSISNNIISKTCRCCFYHISDIRRIRRFISLSVAKTIATALVSSILDYCNSLLYNTANKDIAKLQNCLARVITRSPLFSSSVPLLKSLHWLHVHYRIIFKICRIAYQALSSTQPAYLNSMLTPARNSKQLRSTCSNPLYIPRVKTKAGTRAFSVAAPMEYSRDCVRCGCHRYCCPKTFVIISSYKLYCSSILHHTLT